MSNVTFPETGASEILREWISQIVGHRTIVTYSAFFCSRYMEDIPTLMRDCFDGNHPGKISSNGGHSVLYIPKHLCIFVYHTILPPNEAIGRTDRFMAGASSDISEEMIKLSFFECFQTEPH